MDRKQPEGLTANEAERWAYGDYPFDLDDDLTYVEGEGWLTDGQLAHYMEDNYPDYEEE